jgi:hypothetical protein
MVNQLSKRDDRVTIVTEVFHVRFEHRGRNGHTVGHGSAKTVIQQDGNPEGFCAEGWQGTDEYESGSGNETKKGDQQNGCLSGWI